MNIFAHEKKALVLFVISCLFTVVLCQEEGVVMGEYEFGEPIKFKFHNPNATMQNFIAVDKYRRNWDFVEESLWSDMCGFQSTFNTDDCPPQPKGKVVFQGFQEFDSSDSWPLNPGYIYKACIWNEDVDGYVTISPGAQCHFFTIKNIPRRTVHTASVSPDKLQYSSTETIIISYYSKKYYDNMWVGLFKVEDFADFNKPNRLPLEETYTLTPRKNQDTFEVNIDFVDVGEYILCLVFTYNRPYKFFKCYEESIGIVE